MILCVDDRQDGGVDCCACVWTKVICLAVLFAFGAAPFVAAAEPAARDRREGEFQLAQFQLPPPGGGTTPGTAPAPSLPRQLTYEYAYGSESEISHRSNADLDSRFQDDVTFLVPQVNGFVIYRPTEWLESKLALILDREMLIQGDREVLLPSGEIEQRPKDRNSFLVDEAFVTVHRVTDPFSFTAGRRNYEDERHWLYDTSLDIGAIGFRSGRFRAEATFGREVYVDLDALKKQQRDRVNTYMFYADYRLFDDIKVAGYTIFRDDRDNQDGEAKLFGLRSLGSPTAVFNYWTEFAILRGEDETSRDFRGYGFDIGGTYRFPNLPFSPSITLAYALGSGDNDPNDGTNTQFRQSGLQSNEQRFAGLSEFKYYGEALDPELSNLKIFTVGLGFRPFRDTSLDFVYHRYRLHAFSEDLRNAGITAQLNQDDAAQSYDVGSAFDIILGFRNVFGVQRLGIDLRAGQFYPGKAFRNERADGSFEGADAGAAVIVKFWW